LRVVINTNVIVAAFLRPGSHADRILRLVLQGEVEIALNERILSEYTEVLARERFGLPVDAVETVIERLRAVGFPAPAYPGTILLPDAGDVPFVEVALAARADALITGNVRHYPKKACSGLAVLTPRQFAGRLRADTG